MTRRPKSGRKRPNRLSGVLTKDQKDRFSRQLLIPEIGEFGQEELSGSMVMIAGLGGLGSISSYYLAAAGVGHLKIIDRDCVALDNLNRQILYGTEEIGRLKIDTAVKKLRNLNPQCRVEPLYADILEEHVFDFAEGCQLIIDATDNLPARQALNRICLEKQIPFIYGGIDGWNGMATTFIPGKTGCLSCIFPSQGTDEKHKPTGALGPAAGVIASIQSLEAIMILIGMESRLAGRMLRFLGRELELRETRIERNPLCPLCGSK